MTAKLTKQAVMSAIAEFDSKSRRSFLNEYGFRGARDYFLVVDGKNYDSKAIVAVAYKYTPVGRALTPYELIGGKSDTAKQLQELGFVVTAPGENPDWTWDEHVLALDIYLRLRNVPFGKNHPLIRELSSFLRNQADTNGLVVPEKYRNINGVYMKLMNFRRLDDSIKSKGLPRGSNGEEAVWNRYNDDQSALEAAVELIRSAYVTGPIRDTGEDDEGSAEGSVIIREHKTRERDPGLAKRKKAQVLRDNGKLECEVCEFDFKKKYGDHGEDFIEIHHIDPIALSKPGRKTRPSDLACVCSNCHRMLHRNGLRSIEWLKLQLN